MSAVSPDTCNVYVRYQTWWLAPARMPFLVLVRNLCAAWSWRRGFVTCISKRGLLAAIYTCGLLLLQGCFQLRNAWPGVLSCMEQTCTRNSGARLLSIKLTLQPPLPHTGLGQYISGSILFEETLYDNAASGESFVELMKKQGIIPGIKTDKGLVPLVNSNNESWTQGLTGLADRSAEYYKQVRALLFRCYQGRV